jgi:hypothetical protein
MPEFFVFFVRFVVNYQTVVAERTGSGNTRVY